MEIKVKVCDVCRNPNRETHRYRVVAEDGREASTDRCDAHAHLFEDVLAGLNTTPPPDVRPSRGGRPPYDITAHLTTLEEIERKKSRRQ